MGSSLTVSNLTSSSLGLSDENLDQVDGVLQVADRLQTPYAALKDRLMEIFTPAKRDLVKLCLASNLHSLAISTWAGQAEKTQNEPQQLGFHRRDVPMLKWPPHLLYRTHRGFISTKEGYCLIEATG